MTATVFICMFFITVFLAIIAANLVFHLVIKQDFKHKLKLDTTREQMQSIEDYTTIFNGSDSVKVSLDETFKLYADAFKKGIDLKTASILQAYACPSSSELWVIFDRLDLDVIYEFTEHARSISRDFCTSLMPILLPVSRFSRDNLSIDAIELEVKK